MDSALRPKNGMQSGQLWCRKSEAPIACERFGPIWALAMALRDHVVVLPVPMPFDSSATADCRCLVVPLLCAATVHMCVCAPRLAH